MQYITSVERIGMARGMEKGVVIGRVEGRVEGRVDGASGLLRRLLEHRFGVLPVWAVEQLSSASEQKLDAWGVAVLTAPTLKAVFNTD